MSEKSFLLHTAAFRSEGHLQTFPDLRTFWGGALTHPFLQVGIGFLLQDRHRQVGEAYEEDANRFQRTGAPIDTRPDTCESERQIRRRRGLGQTIAAAGLINTVISRKCLIFTQVNSGASSCAALLPLLFVAM